MPTVDNLVSYHTKIWTWAVVPVFVWITNFSSSHALIHLSLMFLKLILNHRIFLTKMSIWRLVLSLVRNVFIVSLYCISLFLFTHWALNKLLHLDNTPISLATVCWEVSSTSWLHHDLLGWVILALHHLIVLVFDNIHFVYFVLIHVSLNGCTVTDSSGPSVAHCTRSFLIILTIVNDFIRVISVSSWRLEYLW